MNFLVQFLVFEIWSILYFTLLNSDLRLGHMAGKQRSLALQGMPLTLTWSHKGVKPKACSVQEHSLGGGCGGWSPHPWKNKISSNFCRVPAKKIQNLSYLNNWKLKKKPFIQKMSARSIPIYPANLAIYEKSWIFGSPILRPSFF